MGDKFNGDDPYNLLQGIADIKIGNERVFLLHRAWDRWDDMYGDGKFDYQVYALCDEHDAGEFVYGPLRFNYRPCYIGHGIADKRCFDSAGNGRQKDKAGEKYYWIEQMAIHRRNIRIEILGRFYTKPKAEMVEIKLLTLMKNCGVYLTNANYTWTQVALNESDFTNPEVVLFC